MCLGDSGLHWGTCWLPHLSIIPLTPHSPLAKQQTSLSQFAFCCCNKDNDLKQLWGRKGLFQFTGHSPSWREIRAKTPGGDLEAETETEATEEHRLAPCVLFSLFSCTVRDHLPRGKLGPSTSITDQENRWVQWGNFLNWGSPLPDSACIKLTEHELAQQSTETSSVAVSSLWAGIICQPNLHRYLCRYICPRQCLKERQPY